MGNSPSTTKPATTPTPHHQHHQYSTSSTNSHSDGRARESSSRSGKKDPKGLISHRPSASSPEASIVQAQGSTIGPKDTNSSRPLSILNSSSSPSTATSSQVSTAPLKPPVTKPQPRPSEDKDEPSKPVAVPTTSNNAVPSHPEQPSSVRSSQYDDSTLISNPASNSVQDMSYHLARPPRLPLPIEEEIHTPGSPIIAPADIGEPIGSVEGLDWDDQQSELTRKASGLSNATDEDDTEELRVDKTRPTVPTRVEWRRGGTKVYVTGTPFQWSRKQRLYPSKEKGREGVLEAIIPVFPGTHHIKFLVDGSMETSPHLPTTVDFGNNLVNYIEVSGDDAVARILPLDAAPPAQEVRALPSRHPSETALQPGQPKPPAKKVIPPAETFSGRIPRYLAHFDQPEDTKVYQLSVAALDKLPTPPSLPGFLSKPIMNNITLIKDDNSVLNMPNHTVLNHLATSSIKNNVLAVSATTRYKNKYVTTIIYKPTSDDS